MKFLKCFLIVSISLFFSQAHADDGFKSWLKSRTNEYSSFREARDKEFYSFLKGEWKKFDIEEGKKEDTAPKPDKVPVVEQQVTEKKEKKEIKVKSVKKRENIKPPVKKIKKRQPVHINYEKKVTVSFFGEQINLPEVSGIKKLSLSSADKDGVAAFWTDFAAVDLSSLLSELKYSGSKLNLNGWGYLLLVKSFADTVLKDENSSRVLTWGLMLKSGYDVRIGFSSGRIALLYQSYDEVFGTPFFTLVGKRFYLFKDKFSSLKSYDADYEGATEKLSIALNQRPKFDNKSLYVKNFKFSYKGKEYSIKGYYNLKLIKFMQSLPQLALDRYVSGRPEKIALMPIVRELKKYIVSFSPEDKVDFILRFVQKAFPYETDDKQFGMEKYFYPEEMLYYRYSDCEDRATFFLYLARLTTGYDAVLLDYPGHIASAVNLSSDISGAYILVDGKRFYVADPTYINANTGMIMPNLKGKKPEIIFPR